MHRILISLHVALVASLTFPVYGPCFHRFCVRLPWGTPLRNFRHTYTPLEETGRIFEGEESFLGSVVAAGFPGWLALLNLPLLWRVRGASWARWNSCSSMVLGALSTCVLSQLLVRYGDGREWGAWVIWALGLLLLIAGTASVARQKSGAAPLPVIRDSSS